MCCLLLILTVVSVVMTRQTATLSNLTAENQQLMTERSVLARETEELSRTAGNLNWTLGVIMKYDKFPVSEFCPEKSECSFLQYVSLSTQKWFSCMDDVFVSLHLTLKIKDSNPSIIQFLWFFSPRMQSASRVGQTGFCSRESAICFPVKIFSGWRGIRAGSIVKAELQI